jgi:hypothetical protein
MISGAGTVGACCGHGLDLAACFDDDPKKKKSLGVPLPGTGALRDDLTAFFLPSLSAKVQLDFVWSNILGLYRPRVR